MLIVVVVVVICGLCNFIASGSDKKHRIEVIIQWDVN
jgi:hypothetical protein